MKFKKISNGYIIELKKGEEVIESLTAFCVDNNINSGAIAGVGGTDNVSIKYYDLETRTYITKNFSGKNYEILSLNGNVSLVDGKHFFHIHIVLGDSDFNAFGGHLGSCNIGIIAEITLTLTSDEIINRKFDDEFRANLLNI